MNGFNKLYEVGKNGKKGETEYCVSNCIDFSTMHSCKLEIYIAALLFGQKRESIHTYRSSIEVMTFECVFTL